MLNNKINDDNDDIYPCCSLYIQCSVYAECIFTSIFDHISRKYRACMTVHIVGTLDKNLEECAIPKHITQS